MSATPQSRGLRLKLPATSANLGPGFDAVALALSMHLTIEAHPAPEWEIHVTGRDAEICEKVDGNLIIDTYRQAVEGAWIDAPAALSLKIHNDIPIGMGCGSSAAAILAGTALMSHFSGAHLSDSQIVSAASYSEGHPDNVAACWHGGFTVSAASDSGVETASFIGNPEWELMLAIPPTAFATKQARALLPDSYLKADTIFNVQRTGLLVAAFAQGRLDLLKTAMQDRMHQPYRLGASPLLERLLPLTSEPWIAGVALSGAGPSVLMFLHQNATPDEKTRLLVSGGRGVEWKSLRIAEGAERATL